jgi:hypothetical protein
VLLLLLLLLLLRRCSWLAGVWTTLCVGTVLWRLAAILLEQLLSRVVLGCDLELLDSLVALFVQLIDMALASGDAIFK